MTEEEVQAIKKKIEEAFQGVLEETSDSEKIVKAKKKIRESTPELVKYIGSISEKVFGCTITVNDIKEWKYLEGTNDIFSFVIDKNEKSEKYVIRKLRYWVYKQQGECEREVYEKIAHLNISD
ncbi:MAG: hypothetical protein LBD24_02110, partial [Spirochaetaceae bacterium]|nr:hypothetical protein [Spirochaetaceae bacterium]